MPHAKCPKCGSIYYRPEPTIIIVCPCYRICPLCGKEMTAISPDFNPQTYRNERGFDHSRAASKSEMDIATRYVCTNHTPPYYSNQKPVEVELS